MEYVEDTLESIIKDLTDINNLEKENLSFANKILDKTNYSSQDTLQGTLSSLNEAIESLNEELEEAKEEKEAAEKRFEGALDLLKELGYNVEVLLNCPDFTDTNVILTLKAQRR